MDGERLEQWPSIAAGIQGTAGPRIGPCCDLGLLWIAGACLVSDWEITVQPLTWDEANSADNGVVICSLCQVRMTIPPARTSPEGIQ